MTNQLRKMEPNDSIECKMKFDVPDGYFDTLADNVMQRIDFDDHLRRRRRTITLRAIVAMAAVVTGVVFMTHRNVATDLPENPQQQFAEQYVNTASMQLSDINVIEYLDQSAQQDDGFDAYDTDLLAMYASPVNFMY